MRFIEKRHTQTEKRFRDALRHPYADQLLRELGTDALALLYHYSIHHNFLMSTVKSVFTNVITANVKGGDNKTQKKALPVISPEIFKATVKETRENLDILLGEGEGKSVITGIKAALISNGYDPKAKTVKPSYAGLISPDQCVEKGQPWPAPNSQQWANLVKLVNEVSGLAENAEIGPNLFNPFTPVARVFYTHPTLSVELENRKSDETGDFIDEILAVLLGVNEEKTADPAEAAKALAEANGKKVETKEEEKPVENASHEQLPADANLPSTTQAATDVIVNTTREQLQNVVAPLVQNDHDIEEVMKLLLGIRERNVAAAGAAMTKLKADLAQFGLTPETIANSFTPAALPEEVPSDEMV